MGPLLLLGVHTALLLAQHWGVCLECAWLGHMRLLLLLGLGLALRLLGLCALCNWRLLLLHWLLLLLRRRTCLGLCSCCLSRGWRSLTCLCRRRCCLRLGRSCNRRGWGGHDWH